MFNVLFLCTGNSARSILAEALINDPSIGRGRFRGFSAGSHPRGVVDPMAVEWLRAAGLPTEQLRSKSWDEFAGPDAPPLHFILTVCDNAAHETCPIWPGHPATAHWGVPDPAAVTSSEDARRQAFDEAAATLRRRIELFAKLPLAQLNGLALQQQLNDIGRR
jgi:arsenate reductase (thioredoxin)